MLQPALESMLTLANLGLTIQVFSYSTKDRLHPMAPVGCLAGFLPYHSHGVNPDGRNVDNT